MTNNQNLLASGYVFELTGIEKQHVVKNLDHLGKLPLPVSAGHHLGETA